MATPIFDFGCVGPTGTGVSGTLYPGGGMADAPDLGSGAERCKGSSPFLGIGLGNRPLYRPAIMPGFTLVILTYLSPLLFALARGPLCAVSSIG